MRIIVTEKGGTTVIVSELGIIMSTTYPTATVLCSNGDQRFMPFRTFGKKLKALYLA